MRNPGRTLEQRSDTNGAEPSKRHLSFLIVFLAWMGVIEPLSVDGAIHVVRNLDDGGPESLREAIATAQARDTISFDVRGMIVLTNGELLINKTLRIVGPGATNLTISAHSQSRVLEIFTNT